MLSATGTTENPYLYRGEWWDAELRLQYLRSRYYEPETGRFLSPDPFEGVVESPVSRHRYLYGNANPVVFEDPSGEVSAVAGELQASSIASILAKISSPIPGLVSAAGLAGAWFARRRGDYNLWSGKAYPVKWKLSEPGIEPPYFWPGLSSVTGTRVEASIVYSNTNNRYIKREAEWIVGTLDFFFNIIDDGISTSQLPYKGDSFKAYTHKKAGTHPIILTPFTIGGKISASLAPGTDFNASFKSFLMGVGFAGIASTNSAYLSLSASGSVGFSILRPGSDDYNPVNPVNKLAT
ncbi:MAG: RHS repeat-associated core domain-containing protein [Phormidium sp.]